MYDLDIYMNKRTGQFSDHIIAGEDWIYMASVSCRQEFEAKNPICEWVE